MGQLRLWWLALVLALLPGCAVAPGQPLAAPELAGDVELTILQTTDLHHMAKGVGHQESGPSAEQGGYDRIAAYVAQVRASAGHPVLLVDSGDWSMGSLYDLTLGQRPLALLFMDALRYDCATLGNHEFDYGPAGLARMLGAADAAFAFRTPLVASNLVGPGNTELDPLLGPGRRIPPTREQTLDNGLRIGYIGLMGREAALDAPAAAPLAFADPETSYPAIQARVDSLRQRCHLVIALSHSGTAADGGSGEDVDLARHVRGIDVIASGHSHQPLARAVSVAQGDWETRIINAGAFGTHLARLDLRYRFAAGRTEVLASALPAMNDADLARIRPGLVGDPAVRWLVGQADLGLNAALGAVFTGVARFPDYAPGAPERGLYHPVAATAGDLVGAGPGAAPGPNGLGNLCADAQRALPNQLIAAALRAQGWNGRAGDPRLAQARARLRAEGFDPTPVIAAIVPAGSVRGTLTAGRALTFADIYNVLPLGCSPDPAQPLPVGYPLVSAYLAGADLKRLCALQLLGQTGLIPADYYLNLSGLQYSLGASALYEFFKVATAAGVLNATAEQAAAGAPGALLALAAVRNLGADAGAGLRQAMAAGNGYAGALVALNDPAPDPAQVLLNLRVLGQVAGAGGEAQIRALLLAKAEAAVDQVAAFAPEDRACTGPASPLQAGSRYRVAASLYTVLMVAGVRQRFGLELTVFQADRGPGQLGGGDLAAVLGNRFTLRPGAVPLREAKEWMALLLYLGTPPGQGGHFPAGRIGAEYAGGAAVAVRAASYPKESLGRLRATLLRMQGPWRTP